MPAYLNANYPNYCNRIYNFQLSKQIYNRIQKHLSHNTNATIHHRLSEDSWIIPLTSLEEYPTTFTLPLIVKYLLLNSQELGPYGEISN